MNKEITEHKKFIGFKLFDQGFDWLTHQYKRSIYFVIKFSEDTRSDLTNQKIVLENYFVAYLRE